MSVSSFSPAAKRGASLAAVSVLGVGLTLLFQHYRPLLPVSWKAEQARERLHVSLAEWKPVERAWLVWERMTPAERHQWDVYHHSLYPSVEAARAALAVNPRDAKAHRTLGDLHACGNALWRKKIAVHEFRAALAAEPNNPDTKFRLALALDSLGQWQESVKLLQQVKAYLPDRETADLFLARILAKHKAEMRFPA